MLAFNFAAIKLVVFENGIVSLGESLCWKKSSGKLTNVTVVISLGYV